MGLHTISFFFIRIKGLNELSIAFPFLQGPFLYLYILCKVKRLKRLQYVHLLHAVPFLLFVGYQYYNLISFTFGEDDDTHLHYISFLSFQNPFGVLFVILLAGYLFFSYKLTTQVKEYKIWMRSLILSFTAIWIFSLVAMFFPNAVDHHVQMGFDYFIFLFLTAFVYIASYFGFKENIFKTDIHKIGKTKYEKSALSDLETETIWNNLQKLMKEEKLYIKPELNLGELANYLKTSKNKLSQVINEQANKTFNDYVNAYRVNQAKEMIDDQSHRHLTLLAIAYDSGFSSKSTFNRVFKKQEGITPSEYLKRKAS